jgi:hypothetical protein
MEIFAAYDWKPFQSCFTKFLIKNCVHLFERAGVSL